MNIMKEFDLEICYIHGFASSKNSSTGQWIKDNFEEVRLLEYDSGATYAENFTALKEQVKGGREIIYVGSSLGGYYAMQMMMYAGIYSRCILINPVTEPRTLKHLLGTHKNFHTGKDINFTEEVWASYPEIDFIRLSDYNKNVLLAKDDEVLDYKIAQKNFQGMALITYIKGGHRLEDYPALKTAINDFIYFGGV